MAHFIQLHILNSYPASNLNRDDTGRPKTLKYGGAERLRISSQSLKRAFREFDIFADNLPQALGKRSIVFMKSLVDGLKAAGLDEAEAQERAEFVITAAKLGKPKKEDKSKTEQLVHLGPDELALLDELVEKLSAVEKPDLKGLTILKHKPRAADIAMFGRMLADNPGYDVEAAVQVAHAFTTHRIAVEDDFYTAVDDLKNEDDLAVNGAGFLGVQQYGAGTFYLYICVNADLLLNNLDGDKALAKSTLKALIEAAAKVSPRGKQNSYASHSRAHFILEEIGTEAPRSLAQAFQCPVGRLDNDDDDYMVASIKRLKKLQENYTQAYDERIESVEMNVGNSESLPFAALVEQAQNIIDRI